MSSRREIIQLVLSLLIAMVSAVDVVGQKASLPNILGLAFGSLGTGIGIGKYIERRRAEKSRETGPAPR